MANIVDRGKVASTVTFLVDNHYNFELNDRLKWHARNFGLTIACPTDDNPLPKLDEDLSVFAIKALQRTRRPTSYLNLLEGGGTSFGSELLTIGIDTSVRNTF